MITYRNIEFEIDYGGDRLHSMLVLLSKAEKKSALRMSIAKWQLLKKLAKEGKPVSDGGAFSCALCQIYGVVDNCLGCPVYEATYRNMCRGTPYGNCRTMYFEWLCDNTPENLERLIDSIQDEIDFLRSLKGDKK